ncbi:hypothetical protein [Bordetella sp. 02P26C-1]|uniref:hypothetical protein n=1 Tax=Bordetella sp. 02P26C-1 TaxID=2683195 RepID=UPI001354D336|nr:hypothetical protein [Bordetella sp. 02P26C-1]MVW80119.1 hypothetical protein [Bordetella sp. 02P26C-1]
MEIAILTVIVIIALIFFSMSRGKKAVQAYVFLAARGEGKSEAEANDIARRIDTHSAAALNNAMRTFCHHCYGGQQLAMISSARLDGFSG